jgi:hypothetical protein
MSMGAMPFVYVYGTREYLGWSLEPTTGSLLQVDL